jgi:hypothetical protein
MSQTNGHNQEKLLEIKLEVGKTPPDCSRNLCWKNADIVEIVINSGASVRLTNVLIWARDANLLPVKTIEEYHISGFDIQEQFLRLPNMGQISATELHKLMMSFELTSEPNIQELGSEPNSYH